MTVTKHYHALKGTAVITSESAHLHQRQVHLTL